MSNERPIGRAKQKLPWIVVGAGVAGAHVAARLHAAGESVLVLEKSRGPGGRCATRQVGDQAFNHGALSCRARDPHFRSWMVGLEQRGLARRWEGSVGVIRGGQMQSSPDREVRWVGVPGNRSWASASLEGVPLRTKARVTRLVLSGGSPRLVLADEIVETAGVVLTPPLAQVLPWLPAEHPWAALLGQVDYGATWALMARGTPPEGWPELALVEEGCIERVMLQAPRAQDAPTPFVVHMSPQASRAWLEHAPEEVTEQLLAALRALGWGRLEAAAPAHRWRYARVESTLSAPWLEDEPHGLWATGDAFGGASVEGAWCAADRLADHLLAESR